MLSESEDEAQIVFSVLKKNDIIPKLSILAGLLLLDPKLPVPLRKSTRFLTSFTLQYEPIIELNYNFGNALPKSAFGGMTIMQVRPFCFLMLFMSRNFYSVMETFREPLIRKFESKIPQLNFNTMPSSDQIGRAHV